MIELHNSLTGRKETLVPTRPNEVRMYVCGITPYDTCHLGHARCYVVFDVVRRVLRANGYQVTYVQNFTDVDDKIIARAAEKGKTTLQLAQENIDDFFTKMDALGIERADVYPRVTEHIPEIVALIKTLEDKRLAYALPDGAYYAVRRFASYGKLAKRPIEELILGARVEVDKDKKDPLDFALWKAAKPGEPSEVTWPSPWGAGRPGWHIECSAMALKHLPGGLDIHGGGLDLIFPHHENEIAQSEGATGKTFARYWMHNGFVTVNKEKMSKSLGNFFSLSDIFSQYHPSIVRYMLLTVHYRSPLDFSPDLLDQSRQALSGLKDAIARATFVTRRQSEGLSREPAPPATLAEVDTLHKEFMDFLADDFNTPGALAALHKMFRLLETQFGVNDVSVAAVRYILKRVKEASSILGIDVFPRTQDILIPGEVTDLCRRREEARLAKDWKEADRLRSELLSRGYVVEDTPQGPRVLPKANV